MSTRLFVLLGDGFALFRKAGRYLAFGMIFIFTTVLLAAAGVLALTGAVRF
jgi:hypothetical protein